MLDYNVEIAESGFTISVSPNEIAVSAGRLTLLAKTLVEWQETALNDLALLVWLLMCIQPCYSSFERVDHKLLLKSKFNMVALARKELYTTGKWMYFNDFFCVFLWISTDNTFLLAYYTYLGLNDQLFMVIFGFCTLEST